MLFKRNAEADGTLSKMLIPDTKGVIIILLIALLLGMILYLQWEIRE
ncbi:MAG: hypothetical protein ACKPKT_22760 [Dolichospermum sp.]